MRYGTKPTRTGHEHSMVESLESRVMFTAFAAHTPSVIVPLAPGRDGRTPAGLVTDIHGNLFGEMSNGGKYGNGTLFEIVAGKTTVTVLHSFKGSEGEHPFGQLVVDANGNLFGVTRNGGVNGLGTLFELAAGTGVVTAVRPFDAINGVATGALALDATGFIFGATKGGTAGGGAILLVNDRGSSPSSGYDGEFTKGTTPGTVLVAGRDGGGFGGVYGTASGLTASYVFNIGGPFATPEIVIPGGTSTNIHQVAIATNQSLGEFTGGIQEDASGNIFVTTFKGGTGALLEIAKNGTTFTTLAKFGGATGRQPTDALVIDSFGDLFGTTSAGSGKLWSYEPARIIGSKLVPLQTLGGRSGRHPSGDLTLTTQGVLVGATRVGGRHGDGAVFFVNLTPQISPAS